MSVGGTWRFSQVVVRANKTEIDCWRFSQAMCSSRQDNVCSAGMRVAGLLGWDRKKVCLKCRVAINAVTRQSRQLCSQQGAGAVLDALAMGVRQLHSVLQESVGELMLSLLQLLLKLFNRTVVLILYGKELA